MIPKRAIKYLLMATIMGMSLTACGKEETTSSDETSMKEEKITGTSHEKETGEKPEYEDANLEIYGLKAYYKLAEVVEESQVPDASGNGFDAQLYNAPSGKIPSESGALYLTNGAYIEMPADVFRGEDTLTISLWLKNYSGAINTSAIYFGTTQALPLNYWILNPSNPAGQLKSVMTDSDNVSEPYKTEIGISPSVASGGVSGPMTDMRWNHYVTVITPEELTVYANGKAVGTVKHTKKISEFGNDIVAYIGKSAYQADPTYTGFIKEVKIYDKVLSEAEILEEYNSMDNKTVQTNATETDIFISERADPFITKGSDGYYYFTATYPMYGAADKEGNDRIILRRATTIEGLATAEEKVIWDEKESETAHRFIWAPEIHEINGKWYVYFAASGQANNVWDINCHVIACDGSDPYNDTWTDKGKFQAATGDYISFTGFSLDMTYFECNGVHYVIWAQKVGESNVYMATINPDEPWKTTSKAMLMTKPEYYWERVSIPVNEGPAVMIHNDTVYLAFSASATGPEYCIGLMYADVNADLMDRNSWTKVETPLLTSEDLIGEYGPGHNSFIKDEDGNWVFVYHSRSEKCFRGECGYGSEDPLYDPCRSARIRKVQWSEDGMPILNQ